MKVTRLHWLGMIAVAAAPLVSGYSQETPAPAAPATNAVVVPANIPPSSVETVRLAKSGVGDDVVVAFVKNSRTLYNLNANDILALKEAGISSPVMAAMLSHDNALRSQKAVVVSPAAPSSPNTYEQRLYGPGSSAPISQPVPQPPSVAASSQPVATTPPPVTVAAPPPPAPGSAPTAPPPAQVVPPAPVVQPPQPPPPSTVIVEQAPPPPQVELVPVCPGPDYYWTGGYWSWRGGGWVWVSGCWVHRPGPGAIWVGGHWARHGRGYIWIGGRWRF